MRFPSNRILLGSAMVVAGWLALGACDGSPIAVVDDDAGEGGADGGGGADVSADSGSDATVDAPEGSDGAPGKDASVDQVASGDAQADATEGGVVEAAVDTGATDAADAATGEASTGEAGTGDAAAGDDAAAEGGTGDAAEVSEAGEDGGSDAGDAAIEGAAGDSATDAPAEAAACSFAGLWQMTVQTVTAVPSFCQGVMDCTNCGVLFDATATQSTPTTIAWTGVSPGGTICTDYSGSITPSGQFQTNETNCSPYTSTFDGQIDLPTCSLSATYVYVVGTCTITMSMTGVQ